MLVCQVAKRNLAKFWGDMIEEELRVLWLGKVL